MNVPRWLVGILSLSISMAACDRTRADDAKQDATGTSGTTTIDSVPARVADIVGAPHSYVGKTVTVEADVEEVLGPRAFALDEDAPLAGGTDRDLLVLSGRAGSLADIDDQWLNNKVRVTGTVRPMSVVEIEREVGWDLDPELELELERADAVLIASSVNRVRQDATTGAEQAGTNEQARAQLPRTASPLPLAGVIGVLSLGAAVGVRWLRRR
jgi:hypothetical protein